MEVTGTSCWCAVRLLASRTYDGNKWPTVSCWFFFLHPHFWNEKPKGFFFVVLPLFCKPQKISGLKLTLITTARCTIGCYGSYVWNTLIGVINVAHCCGFCFWNLPIKKRSTHNVLLLRTFLNKFKFIELNINVASLFRWLVLLNVIRYLILSGRWQMIHGLMLYQKINHSILVIIIIIIIGKSRNPYQRTNKSRSIIFAIWLGIWNMQ